MQKFEDIMNQFNSEDEDENYDLDYDININKNKNRKSTSSLNQNSNNKIKEKLSNNQNEYEQNENEKINEKLTNNQNENEQNENKRIKRDIFGYFINDENDDNESEESNSNNENQEKGKKSNRSSSSSENKNSRSSREEENEIEDKEENNYNENLENKNNDSINNTEKKDDLYEHLYSNESNEQNNLINDVNRKSNKHDYLDSVEGEAFRMNSFRPNPIPGSPKFSKRVSVNNNNTNNNNDINSEEKKNNNNLQNFTETIETKIEGDISKENSINRQMYKNELYTHNNNIISLGKMPNKDNINISESIQSVNINNNMNKIEENNIKSIEDEEQEEEAFLKREELIRDKEKENEKEKKNNKNKIEDKDDEGKENVSEDEDESLPQNMNKLKIQENIENKKNKKNSSMNKENIKEELTEDEEENNKINNINNNNNYKKKQTYNEINNIKTKDVSIKLLDQYKKDGGIKKSNIKQSDKNSLYNKNNVYLNKKTSERNFNKQKIYQVPISTKNSKYNSPSSRNKNNNNNVSSTNYFSENNQQISTIKKNTSFKLNSNYSNYNSNLSKKNSFKNQNDLQSIKKNLYNQKNEIKPKVYEQGSNKNINKVYSSETYSFFPKINQKSKEMYNKKNNLNNKKPNIPIGISLYEDANNKKEKFDRICLTENNNIISKANSKKINEKSKNMVIERINKKIDNVIKKFSITGKLSIVGITQCLYELNIITELIKIKDNIEDINDDLDLVELQSIIESINKKDIKKTKEVELLEQLWIIINPSQTQYINSRLLNDFLKILFSSNNNIKDLTNNIEKIFNKYNIINNRYSEEDDENNELYKSPLRNKKYNRNELWSLQQFIKIFLNLKKDIKAYKDNDYQKGDIYKDIIKERDKDLTFQPDLSNNSFFYKHSKYNYNQDNSNNDSQNTSILSNFSSKRQKNNFDKVYERFMAEKELHEKTLERIREIKREKELKMCTNVPKINKYIPKSIDKKIKNSTIESEESKTLHKNKSNLEIKVPRFQKLYNSRKDLTDKSNKTFMDEKCTFRPILTANNEIMNKTFSNMKNMKKPKGYNEYVQRNRSILEKKEYEKKLEEDKKYGRGYEKIQKKKLKPFNITDLNGGNGSNRKIKKINIPIPSPNSNRSNRSLEQNNNDFVNNFENEKVGNIINDIYINIDIKIPNGLLKPLKIYNRNDKDTVEMVNNFCNIYSINDENKKEILKKVIEYKNAFFNINLNKGNNKEGFMLNEDSEMATYANSNNSNH